MNTAPEGGAHDPRLDETGEEHPGVLPRESDLIALSEGLPILVRGFEPQRTWTRGVAVGYNAPGSRFEARIQDQSVDHALLIRPSSFASRTWKYSSMLCCSWSVDSAAISVRRLASPSLNSFLVIRPSLLRSQNSWFTVSLPERRPSSLPSISLKFSSSAAAT